MQDQGKREFQLRLKRKKATLGEFGETLPLGVKRTVQGSGIVGTVGLESSLTRLESFLALKWTCPVDCPVAVFHSTEHYQSPARVPKLMENLSAQCVPFATSASLGIFLFYDAVLSWRSENECVKMTSVLP